MAKNLWLLCRACFKFANNTKNETGTWATEAEIQEFVTRQRQRLSADTKAAFKANSALIKRARAGGPETQKQVLCENCGICDYLVQLRSTMKGVRLCNTCNVKGARVLTGAEKVKAFEINALRNEGKDVMCAGRGCRKIEPKLQPGVPGLRRWPVYEIGPLCGSCQVRQNRHHAIF
ncbi:hypothetical protein K461DRAFT_281976 [Myriangium duriaei CBS 260.36]|uniref:Uncharacterized protein n=1 Tax=Myriangium duriaei CBS 260.36 TaxID=1168546 RepID=A0A9P4MJA2_9PEZI|nr:hypothetical protein K461DRAFT_281976 [Myriangium duriaei CBS 260.36]